MTTTDKMNTGKMWNVTADQWSSVLRTSDVAARLLRPGHFVPWSKVRVDEPTDCLSKADRGRRGGEHSAVLPRAGREAWFVDWATENLAFSQSRHNALRLTGQFVRADITRRLPLANKSIDSALRHLGVGRGSAVAHAQEAIPPGGSCFG